MRYELTNPPNFEHARQSAPIAYLPWGAHEWHDKYNPLGTDTLKAQGICEELCAQTGGVVFPGVYCGHGTIKGDAESSFTLEFSRECVELLATEYLRQLAKAGFKVIVVLMGHYGCEHMEAIREVVSDFNDSHDDSVAWAFADFDMVGSGGCPNIGDACFETSYIMYLHSELVDTLCLPGECESLASSARGRAAVNMVVETASAEIQRLLKSKLSA
ncbi:creatininase family protein [bacterium]|nr:creatininase family protein [bacterium]